MKSFNDYFALLDKELTAEEQVELAKSDDLFEYHFTLGLFIRNEFIYPDEEEATALAKLLLAEKNANHEEEDHKNEKLQEFELRMLMNDEDGMSSLLIEHYQKYLCQKLGIEYVNPDDEEE